MANFDISRCEYLTTTNNPTQYYLNVLEKYVSKVAGPDLAKVAYDKTVENLIDKLQGDDINSNKVLHKICFYTFAQVWAEACESTTRYPGKPFALEYVAIDDNNQEYTPVNGFYKKVLQSVKNTIYDPAIQTMLSKPDRYGNYAVIDFDSFSNSIHRSIKNYYDKVEKIDERLLKSEIPNKALHESVEGSIKHFNTEVKKVIYNYKPTNQYGYYSK